MKILDELGDRMKSYYENRTRVHLPRRSNVIIRVDGKAFHTYTRGLKRPFDSDLIDDMDATTKFLCENIQGAKLGYVQSDEISILLTDYDKLTTDAWFDYNVQKMSSISASLATSQFNKLRAKRQLKEITESWRFGTQGMMHINFAGLLDDITLAHFDSRAFSIPTQDEVINYFIWRQQDASKNSISSVAQSLYSHNELNGKNGADQQEMIFQKGQNWNNYPTGQKRGRVIVKRDVVVPTTEAIYQKAKDKTSFVVDYTGDASRYGIKRNQWVVDNEPPIFSTPEGKEYIRCAMNKKREN